MISGSGGDPSGPTPLSPPTPRAARAREEKRAPAGEEQRRREATDAAERQRVMREAEAAAERAHAAERQRIAEEHRRREAEETAERQRLMREAEAAGIPYAPYSAGWVGLPGQDHILVTAADSPLALDLRDAVAGTDPRYPVDGVDGFDVLQCRAPLPGGGFGPDTCPNAGGLDQNLDAKIIG